MSASPAGDPLSGSASEGTPTSQHKPEDQPERTTSHSSLLPNAKRHHKHHHKSHSKSPRRSSQSSVEQPHASNPAQGPEAAPPTERVFKHRRSISVDLEMAQMTAADLEVGLPKWHVIGFLIQLAVNFHTYGAPAHRVEYNLVEAARAYGIETVSIAVTPTMMMITFGAYDSPKAFSRVVRCSQTLVQCEKLYLIDQLIDDISSHRVDFDSAQRRLDEIIGMPPRFPLWVRFLGGALSSGACAPLFFGGAWIELGVSFVIGFIAILFDWIGDHHSMFGLISDIFSGAIAGATAVILNDVSNACFGGIVLSGLVWLLPGTSRMFSAFMTALKLGFGIAIGTAIPFWITVPLRTTCAPNQISPWFTIFFFLAVVSGFNVLLDAHFHQWPGMIFVSAIAYAVSEIGGLYLPKASSEIVPVLAGFAVGLAGNLYAKFTTHPGVVMIFSGMLMLVPGSIGVRSVIALMVQKDFVSGISFGFQMITIGFSITVGSLVANLLVMPPKSMIHKLF